MVARTRILVKHILNLFYTFEQEEIIHFGSTFCVIYTIFLVLFLRLEKDIYIENGNKIDSRLDIWTRKNIEQEAKYRLLNESNIDFQKTLQERMQLKL